MNPGASTTVVAGITNNRVKLWHYLPTKKWNGQVAADTYKGPIAKALKKNRGAKRKYVVLQDNDPTGHKSREGGDEDRGGRLPEVFARPEPL